MSEPHPAPSPPPTLGVILAGGLARRMGGGDKGLRLLGGQPLLQHVIDRLAPQCDGLVLNANGDPARFSGFDLKIVPDPLPGAPGPLAGLLAALDWAASNRPEIAFVATTPVDCPFLPHDFVSRLQASRMATGAPLALARSGGRTHPVNGLWPVSLRQDLRRALEEEDLRRVHAWAGRHGPAIAEWPASPADPFFNANTPGDLAEAERLLEQSAAL